MPETSFRRATDSCTTLAEPSRQRMQPRRVALAILLLLGAVLVGSAAQAESPFTTYFSIPNASSAPTVSFEGSTVTVDAMTVGGRLLWFAIARERGDRLWTRVLRDKGSEQDLDEDGRIEIQVPIEIPRRSVWLFVDVASEQGVIAAPRRLDILPVSVGRRALRRGASRILARGRALDVMWLRPGAGIWHLLVRDGGVNDRDELGYRKLDIDLADFNPQFPPSRPPPGTIEAGDIFVAVDEGTLSVIAATVDQ